MFFGNSKKAKELRERAAKMLVENSEKIVEEIDKNKSKILLNTIQNKIVETMNLIESIQNDERTKYECYEVSPNGRKKIYQDREHYLEDSLEWIWGNLETLTDDIRKKTGISADEKFENGAIEW